MCMIVDDKITAKVKARLKRGKGVAKFWKVYRRVRAGLRPVFSNGCIRSSGRRCSSRRTTRWPLESDHDFWHENAVQRGFHVFLTREEARKECGHRIEVVVPVYCRAEELVAGGRWAGCTEYVEQAVFTHITIKEPDFRKAVS